MVRLGTAALAAYRMQLVDMFIREHLLLEWVMEGERFLRVHRGIAYFYHDDGAFLPFKGVPPEATFGRVKKFLLQLEGRLPSRYYLARCKVVIDPGFVGARLIGTFERKLVMEITVCLSENMLLTQV